MGGPEFTPVFRDETARNTRLDVAEVARPDGRRERHYRLLIGEAGGVVIVARSSRGVLLTSSYREAAGSVLAELPRGLVDMEDSGPAGPQVAAGERELAEETGHRAKRSMLLGDFVVDSAVYPLRVAVVFCEVDASVEPGETDGEVDAAWWMSDAEVDEAIVSGRIRDAISLSALALVRSVESLRGGALRIDL